MNNTKKKKMRIILIIIIFLIILSGCLYWGNTSIQTTYIHINSERIHPEIDGFTIVQVSDLHNASFGHQQERLLQAIESASPDIIAVTGDLIDYKDTDIDNAMDFIKGAIQIAPVYFVTGNHEAWSKLYSDLKEQMLMAGVIVLEDESIVIEYEGASICILGLNDPDFMTWSDSLEKWAMIDARLKDMSKQSDEYTILLSHRPELFDIYMANHIDLVLTGHAHGGQVRLPFVGGLGAPNQGFFPEYSEGVYAEDQTRMMVSRGLGDSMIPLRINNRPELVVIVLET